MESGRSLRILVVDDHEIVRRGLVSVLSRREGFEIVGEAGTVAEAVERASELSPDVVVLDIRLPDGSGVEACREIRARDPNVKVLMPTSYSDEEAIMGSIMAGASGYLLKEIRSTELADAIERVGAGQSLLDPAVTAKVLEQLREPKTEDTGWAQLLPQERQILELIAEGKTNRAIAEEIHLSENTVKNYVSNILSKLDMARRSQAAAYLAGRKARRGERP